MKPWLYGIIAALALVTQAGAQPVPPHVFTTDMASRIDRLAQSEVLDGRTPGIAVGVVEDGRLVYARGFGYANVARRVRVDPGTQFYVGAVSAQFTTGAILLLVQDGKIKLDDRVTKYVPELSIAANVTIAELLQQTSGLPEYTRAGGIPSDQTHQLKINDLIAGANKLQLASTPGTTFALNDFNFVVAGLIVERVSGVTLSDFLQQRIFLPLVMNQTFYASDTGISASRALAYTRGPNGKFVPTHAPDPSWLLGARGIVSNVYDLAKWDIEMPILLHVDAVRDMYTPGGVSGPAQYGMSWVIDRRGGKRFMWYTGEIPGYRSLNAVLPDDHISVIVLTNADSLHGAVTAPVQVAVRVLDVVAPPVKMNLDNAIVTRAREWLEAIADKRFDRTELTPAFSAYLTDDLVANSNFAAYGKLETIVPISSTTEANGDTLYEFIVQYPHDQFHYKFAVSRDGKVDGLLLGP
jgi:D-alanyl-D-alanine carboxypeptidase